MTFASMADDVSELLKYLQIESADVFGGVNGDLAGVRIAILPEPLTSA